MHIAAQPIEFAYDDWALGLARRLDRCGEFWAPIERIGESVGDLVALGLGKAPDRLALSLQPEPGRALLLRGSGISGGIIWAWRCLRLRPQVLNLFAMTGGIFSARCNLFSCASSTWRVTTRLANVRPADAPANWSAITRASARTACRVRRRLNG
jgi:hypothetical protein